MSGFVAPAVVHMWFATGEGYAFHPSVEPELRAVKAALSPLLRGKRPTKNETFILDYADGNLIGEWFPDTACRDAKAINRNPFVLWCVYVQESHDVPADDVLELLRGLELPRDRGAQRDLQVTLPEFSQSDSEDDSDSDVTSTEERSKEAPSDEVPVLGDVPSPQTTKVYPRVPSPRTFQPREESIEQLKLQLTALQLELNRKDDDLKRANLRLHNEGRKAKKENPSASGLKNIQTKLMDSQEDARQAEQVASKTRYMLILCMLCGGVTFVAIMRDWIESATIAAIAVVAFAYVGIFIYGGVGLGAILYTLWPFKGDDE